VLHYEVAHNGSTARTALGHIHLRKELSHTPPGLGRRHVLAGVTAAAALAGSHGIAAAAVYRFVVIGKDGWLFPIWDSLHYIDQAMIKTVTALVTTTVAILKRAGIETVVMMTPAKARIYQEFLPSDQRMARDVEPRYRIMLDALRQSGAIVPDIAALLTNYRRSQPADLLFFKFDTHWTPLAAAVAASDVAKQILSKIPLPSSPTPGTQLGPPVMLEDPSGDLANLLQPAVAAKYPPESYRTWKVVEADSGLLDDDAADIAAVGNSYLHPRWNFAPVLSNQLGRPVALVWKVHSFGPYATLLSYLNGDVFKKQRPKVLVWDLHEIDLQTSPTDPDIWGQNAMAPAVFLSSLQQALGV
jgi:alginate O-acetyltransferase complex protein AlgJ